ncbi:MAG: VWA domain-containing protein [Alphaproteobacteria bacterium]|nr:VWA domain-containing protein [Alphaproteobacteria bacterium]
MSVGNSFGLLHRQFGRYLKQTSGNVTMMLALSAVPVSAIVGAAVDYANITRDMAAFQAAADAAVLAVASSDRASLSNLDDEQKAQRISELEDDAARFIVKNYNSKGSDVAPSDVALAIDGASVILTTTHEVPTLWLGSLGIYGPTVTVTSEVKKAARPVELVMVMDTTGSMGTTYMNQAKTAARNLLNTLYGGDAEAEPESEYIRIGLVPFSGAVRLDQDAYDFDLDWIDTSGAAAVSKLNFNDTEWHNYMAWQQLSNRPWNGCVEARATSGDYNVTDTPPTGGDSLFTPYFAPDEPTFSGSTSSPYNFLNSYIGNSGSPNEQSGISTSTSSSNHINRQNNEKKYVGRTISSENNSSYGPWFNCAKSALVPLTYDRAKVEAGINAMTASGSTVIPEGLAWGWRALSPTEPLTKVEAGPTQPAGTISAYNHPKWQKILVLMTDGENDVLSNGNQINSLNGTWYSAYGRGKAATGNRFGTTNSNQVNGALDTAMSTLCENIKAQGIVVYTVAFRVNSTSIQNRLRSCASTDAHYSYAANGVALAAIFNHIGENVANTSIYLSK